MDRIRKSPDVPKLLLKISPDLSFDELAEIAKVIFTAYVFKSN